MAKKDKQDEPVDTGSKKTEQAEMIEKDMKAQQGSTEAKVKRDMSERRAELLESIAEENGRIEEIEKTIDGLKEDIKDWKTEMEGARNNISDKLSELRKIDAGQSKLTSFESPGGQATLDEAAAHEGQ